MPRFPSCLIALFLLVAPAALVPAAHAQMAPVPSSVQPALAPDPLIPALKQMASDFKRGFYDDVINRTGELIGDDEGKADPRLLYWRGLTFYQLAWFAEASADLTRARAQNVELLAGGFAASVALDKMARVQPFVPPLEYAVNSGGQTVFRVNYVTDDAATKTAISCLAPAYRASANLFGSDVRATPVYIFDNYEQFAACFRARIGRAPESWIAAVTINNVLYIPLRDRKGEATTLTNPDFFRSMVAHEFNHAMLRRLMGTTELPKWFVEGLADYAGGQVVPNDVKMNDYEVKRLFAANALLAPTQLEYDKTFGAHTGLGAQMGDAGAGIAAPSPYQQSYNMTRYLMSSLKRDDLPNFLNLVRDNNNFSRAFVQQFGASVPEFYQSWYREATRAAR